MADYYDNKAVFITGGSSGIGLAFARALAARGAHIAIFARSRDKLDAAREDIAGQCANPGQSVKAYTLDVEKIDTINPQLRSALDELGVPDMLVSCAGGGIAKSFEDHHLADFSYNFNTNVLGTFGFVHALVPPMRLNGGGDIVLIGSLGGLVPVWGYSAYSSSKAALVCPPEADTPMIAAESATIPAQTRFAKDLV
jgi:3-dehydrosphinganine reductase